MPGAGRADDSERQELHESLRRHDVRHLLHYTPAENVASILACGAILSHRQQQEAGVSVARPHGWGRKRRALADYICCALTKPRGLLRTESREMAVFVIDAASVVDNETLFSPVNSGRASIETDNVLSRVGVESLEALFAWDHAGRLRNSECEILPKSRIELGQVEAIVFDTRHGRRQVWRDCCRRRLIKPVIGWRRPPWRIDDGRYFD